MKKRRKAYDEIRKQYPETISKDQFYRIAHISKATALYLLQSGLVPCIDSGKKTRRYTIRTEDVITYLMEREIHPEDYRAPEMWYAKRSGRTKPRKKRCNRLKKLSDTEPFFYRMQAEIARILRHVPDMHSQFFDQREETGRQENRLHCSHRR